MKTLLVGLAALAIGGTLAAQTATPPAASRLPRGYLGVTPPDSILLSPAPPAAGSAAEARDVAASQAGLALAGGPRWALATQDADLFTPTVASTFSCAAGREIGPAATPKTDAVLRRTLADFGLSTAVIKRQYNRPRPFMANGKPSCTPSAEAGLRRDGSYPSGHSAIGYGWGLILAELLPPRANALVARGRAFGDSRRVCNVHWLSDTEEGRIAAAATLARLHADATFRADLDAARAELAAAKSAPPSRDCAAEAAALDLTR